MKKNKGVALAWVIIAFLIMSIVGIYVTSVMLNSTNRTFYFYKKSQAFEYASSMADIVADMVFVGSNIDSLPTTRDDAKEYFSSDDYNYIYGITYMMQDGDDHPINDLSIPDGLGSYDVEIVMDSMTEARVIVQNEYQGHKYKFTAYLECEYQYVNFDDEELEDETEEETEEDGDDVVIIESGLDEVVDITATPAKKKETHKCNFTSYDMGEDLNYSYCEICYNGFIPKWSKVNYSIEEM
jgi:hypothetical protein